VQLWPMRSPYWSTEFLIRPMTHVEHCAVIIYLSVFNLGVMPINEGVISTYGIF
jgi:hypothetical protein